MSKNTARKKEMKELEDLLLTGKIEQEQIIAHKEVLEGQNEGEVNVEVKEDQPKEQQIDVEKQSLGEEEDKVVAEKNNTARKKNRNRKRKKEAITQTTIISGLDTLLAEEKGDHINDDGSEGTSIEKEINQDVEERSKEQSETLEQEETLKQENEAIAEATDENEETHMQQNEEVPDDITTSISKEELEQLDSHDEVTEEGPELEEALSMDTSALKNETFEKSSASVEREFSYANIISPFFPLTAYSVHDEHANVNVMPSSLIAFLVLVANVFILIGCGQSFADALPLMLTVTFLPVVLSYIKDIVMIFIHKIPKVRLNYKQAFRYKVLNTRLDLDSVIKDCLRFFNILLLIFLYIYKLSGHTALYEVQGVAYIRLIAILALCIIVYLIFQTIYILSFSSEERKYDKRFYTAKDHSYLRSQNIFKRLDVEVLVLCITSLLFLLMFIVL